MLCGVVEDAVDTDIHCPSARNNEYIKSFDAIVTVLEMYDDSAIPQHPILIKTMVLRQGAVNANNLVIDERLAVEATVQEEYLSYLMLSSADGKRYGGLENKLVNVQLLRREEEVLVRWR